MEEITSRVAISSTSEATRQIIERKSAANLPDQPSASGMKPAEIKRAFYAPVLDSTGSVLSEVGRVISEANECFATLRGIEERHKERLESLEKFEKTADENLTALNETAEDHGRRIRGLEHAGISLNIVDDLNTADPELPLSARQGKILKESLYVEVNSLEVLIGDERGRIDTIEEQLWGADELLASVAEGGAF